MALTCEMMCVVFYVFRRHVFSEKLRTLIHQLVSIDVIILLKVSFLHHFIQRVKHLSLVMLLYAIS